MAKFKNFLGGAYADASLPVSAQKCINWYPEQPDYEGAISAKLLRPVEGFKTVHTFTSGVEEGDTGRQLYRTTKALDDSDTGSLIAVVGGSVIWYKPEEPELEDREQLLGTISNTKSRISMADDGFGLIIVDGTTMYRLDMTTLDFGPVEVGFVNPKEVAVLAYRTIVIAETPEGDRNTFYFSDLASGLGNASWDLLDFGQAELSQDPITGLTVAGGFMYLLGPDSYEIWQSGGTPNLPFSRVQVSVDDVGLHASESVYKSSGAVYFIGSVNQGSVNAYKIQGGRAVRISKKPLAVEWQENEVRDCTSWAYSANGHEFVLFNFQALDKTYVYDVVEDDWHERADRDEATGKLSRWSPQYGVSQGGRIFVGSGKDAALFELSSEFTTNDGANILRIRTTAHMNAERKPFRVDRVRFDMQVGQGISREDPDRFSQPAMIMFRQSQDAGKIFGPRSTRSMGRLGEYSKVVEFRRRGTHKLYTAEFSVSDATGPTLNNGWVYYEVSTKGGN